MDAPLVSENGIVERWGRFDRVANAGVNFVCCPMEQIVGTLSSRVTQLEVNEGFSDPNDKLSSGVYKAFYELSDPKKQITAYVYGVAMNEINASKRLKDAAKEKAEGNKVLTVKSAEAEAESKPSGVGVARQRKAIVDGLRGSISQFSGNIKGTTPKDVVDLLLITRYATCSRTPRPNCNTVYVPDCE
ncbi:carboxyl-terminal processing protease [Aureococcus anophagefferens]|uniref:Carboxyl-terminal processing protease n=1 Tax=Aureococcus anophagefferens TaxID=44056 RepID=A0ABR1FXB2_AURAN